MGVEVNKDITVMFASERDGKTGYVILVHKPTGRRLEVVFEEGTQNNLARAIIGDGV